jgi:signal transduction histidine kinase
MVSLAAVLYAAAMLVTAGVNVAFVVWLRWTREWTRTTQAAVSVVGLLTFSAVVTVVRIALGQLTEGTRAMALTFLLQGAVSQFTTVAFVLFAVYFTGRTDLLTRPVQWLLVGLAVVPAVLVATNPVHGWTHAGFGRDPDPFVRLTAETTTLYDLTTLPSNLLVYVAMALLLQFALASRRVSRRQFLTLLAAPVPFIFVRSAGSLGPLIENVNYGVMTTSLILLIIGATLLRGTTFAVDPVARDTVLDDIQDAVLTVDRAGAVADFNDAAARLFPEIGDQIGDPLTEVAPGLVADENGWATATNVDGADSNGDGALDSLEAGGVEPVADGGGGRYVDELVRYRGDDRTVHDVVVSPVTVDGKRRGETLLLRDITERRERKEQLERETEQLDQFVSTVSHDLRNPLTVARGYVETGRQQRDFDQVAEAEVALDRMERMIENSLALAREGRAIDERTLVSLDQAVSAAWRASDTAAATLDLRADGVAVYADPDRLERLFGNLFRNAADHGPEDVTVVVDHTEDTIRVADDGPGVPPAERDRVFERGHTTSEEGTGLGLAIVASIAEAHGWSIAVDEAREGGALFCIEGVDLHHGNGVTAE